MPGSELYFAGTVEPQLTAILTTANAGGAAVNATFMGATVVDQPLPIDWRIYYMYWDKTFTGILTVTPIINAVDQTAIQTTINAPGAAGRQYKTMAAGTAGVGHGDLSGWKVSANGAFTTSGNLTLLVIFSGAVTVQPNKTAWSPT
jgi:hypothetical protein